MIRQPLFPSVWILLGTILLLVLLALLPLLVHPGQRRPDEFWKAGRFYVNPDDPALFVPKRFGIGYTLNFGNRWSWLVLALILLMLALPIILSAVAVRRVVS